MLREFLKKLASFSPVALSRNQYYDRLTNKIIKKLCSPESICVDVGANNGKILQLFIKHCPKSVHFAFEPIPPLYFLLKRKFGSACNVYNVALSNYKGSGDFNYVITDPAYSGLKTRSYNKPQKNSTIQVRIDCLDTFIPVSSPIALIKIDVEGGEFDVLQGSQSTIQRCRPYILFEFGKGGSDAYGITPEKMFLYFEKLGYEVATLSIFLKNKTPLSIDNFKSMYQEGKEYFFIAYCK